MNKRQKWYSAIIIAAVFYTSLGIIQVSAYNHSVGVAIGDEFIWHVEEFTETEGGGILHEITYFKTNITAINDNGADTYIHGIVSESENLTHWTIATPTQVVVGNLTDYQLHPNFIYEYVFISGGTQIGDYTSEILNYYQESGILVATYDYRWGVTINRFTESQILVYTTSGVLRYRYITEQTSEGNFNNTLNLLSINGVEYEHPDLSGGGLNIPGYMPVAFTFALCTGVIYLMQRKSKK